jgi:hypothetical protein
MAGNPAKVFRYLLMPSPPRPAGLIQRYREELQSRHYARRTVELHVSASTQNQALSALLFLYRELLKRDPDLEGVEALVAGVLYAGGLRLMEPLRRRGLWEGAPPPRLGAKASP